MGHILKREKSRISSSSPDFFFLGSIFHIFRLPTFLPRRRFQAFGSFGHQNEIPSISKDSNKSAAAAVATCDKNRYLSTNIFAFCLFPHFDSNRKFVSQFQFYSLSLWNFNNNLLLSDHVLLHFWPFFVTFWPFQNNPKMFQE